MPNLSTPTDEEAKSTERVTSEELNRQITVPAAIQKQTAVFHWDGVNYDIKIKGEPRKLLDDVDGWVKPGTLTALMVQSGQPRRGNDFSLTVESREPLELARQRYLMSLQVVSMGVVSGQIFVDGRIRNRGFQRKTGYVQQQDLHLATTTVREALIFSALLRQPKKVPRQEKIDYVEEVIKTLEMESYADAIVGVPGEGELQSLPLMLPPILIQPGLNVEQRKRLTIAVELAAKPELLLFLDEPTSGLDSQTAWSILALLKKLANNGQAILCTIHQPSAILFQEFDRLLFLASGGRTVYVFPFPHASYGTL